MLENYDNYTYYKDFIKTGRCTIRTKDITIDNLEEHFQGILNIMKDGIELDLVHKNFINIDFDNGIDVDLSIPDYFFNLIMWYLILVTREPIQPKHLFFDKYITRKSIKKYIDEFFIEPYRKKYPNIILNNTIDNTLYRYREINNFSWYLANTINLRDTIDLMNNVKEVDDIIHCDLSSVPLEDVKNVGIELTHKLINYIKDSKKHMGYDHCLTNPLRANEGINIKQLKELMVNIGDKPNGQGGVYSTIINKNFLTGGVSDLLDNVIESGTGRIAQIMSKTNVGESGHLARILGLNNMDTFLHPDPSYVCDSPNFQLLLIGNDKILRALKDRYYRLHPRGIERIIKNNDTHLVGQTIYLRSPMTCASKSRGKGICYRCYGDLAYTNNDINIGRNASEELSSKMTQFILSAKHIIETAIKKMEWSSKFFDLFEVDGNIIKLLDDTNFKNYFIIIDPDKIISINSEDFKRTDYGDESEGGEESSYEDYTSEEFSRNDDRNEEGFSYETYNEFLTSFDIILPNRQIITISTKEDEKLFLSLDLIEAIKKNGKKIGDKIHIPLEALEDYALFFVIIHNNELTKVLDRFKSIIDKNENTSKFNRHTFLQALLNTLIENSLDEVMSIHSEIILSNQLRSVDNILEYPQFQYPNEDCQLLTLNRSLTYNPSITISLIYQKLSKALYNPSTFKKQKASFMDLFFMICPQTFISKDNIISGVNPTDVEVNMRRPISKRSPKIVKEDDLEE